ncbi:unnamed protein product [Microthlaspi erraticum]|uniref:Uncharacterized protein n=1 Tax=Microthlaspi erraticum TaxID=1685480 RepID=A0A6D2KJ35_9BRAS|nr:unnamed protein product [Microthlaspi erraticum]
MKLKEFNAKVKSLPFYVTFEEAWDKHDLVEFFFTTGETKEEVHKLFQKARFPMPLMQSINHHLHHPHHHVNASMSFQQAWRHYPFTTFFHNCKETPQDIKELFEKAKVQPPSRPSTRLKTQVNSLHRTVPNGTSKGGSTY